jgi:hypothetical protein
VSFSAFTLVWQLSLLFFCCSSAGLALRFLLPNEFSLLNKFLFSLLGGFFLVVLIPQNLFYLGVPVRISAWLLLASALIPIWCYRQNFLTRIRAFCLDSDIRALSVVALLTVTFHSVVPIRQGLEWYYGKGYFDQLNYVLLTEFLKEEPYSMGAQGIGLHPWLVGPVGFKGSSGQLSSGPALETAGLKKERIGQSIITAEISVWSGTNGKGGYAGTVIFFLTLLALSLYALLREMGINRFMAAAGALLAACLPAITRLSLDGFLSQTSILFVFPMFACLLRHWELSARSFTLFFSLTLAYLIAAYSEIAPLGLCTFLLGVIFLRQDKMRAKRLILMSAILLIVLMNPLYLGNLIEFLGYQYNLVAGAGSLWDKVAPNVLTLPGWSEIIFGNMVSAPFALLFDCSVISLSLLILAGAILLSRKDKMIFAAVLLPAILVILYLTTKTPFSYYPIAKITLTVLPFMIGLVFVALSRIGANQESRPMGVLLNLLCATIVVVSSAGSVRYYCQVLNNEGLLKVFRGPRFLEVCRALEETKGKRVLIFETHPLLSAWLCYHGRRNDLYFDGVLLSDSVVPPGLSFSSIPALEKIDFVVTRDRMVDLRTSRATCLTSVDDISGEHWTDGHVRYGLGPPARLRFLAFQALSANLQMHLAPGPEATSSPINYLLDDGQGHVFEGEIQGETLDAGG